MDLLERVLSDTNAASARMLQDVRAAKATGMGMLPLANAWIDDALPPPAAQRSVAGRAVLCTALAAAYIGYPFVFAANRKYDWLFFAVTAFVVVRWVVIGSRCAARYAAGDTPACGKAMRGWLFEVMPPTAAVAATACVALACALSFSAVLARNTAPLIVALLRGVRQGGGRQGGVRQGGAPPYGADTLGG
jgi:hypothetical protein